MGHIYGNFGRFCIEGRWESFYIHADYGLAYEKVPLRTLYPGDTFKFFLSDRTTMIVDSVSREGIRYEAIDDAGYNAEAELDAGDMVYRTDGSGRPTGDQVRDDHPLGSLWRDNPHPEIEIVDLDDLIGALTAYRAEVQ